MITSAEVASSTFTATRFREGYDMGDVDACLTKVRRALESYERRAGGLAELTAVQVVNSRFQPTKFRAGYDQDQVDALLDRVVAALRDYEGTGEPTIL